MPGDFLSALGAVFVVIIIFFLAWFIPRLIGKSTNIGSKGKYITILERVPVSKDAYILLVKAFDKVIVVGVTSGTMTTLGGVDANSINIEDTVTKPQSFADVFKGAVGDTLPEGKVKNAALRFMRGKKGGGDDET
jgi:flagellar biosynthetic protein FliO